MQGSDTPQPDRLTEIRARLEKATPGPWQVYEAKHPHALGGVHTERYIGTVQEHPQWHGPLPVVTLLVGVGEHKGDPGVPMLGIDQDDADLIAHAPEDIAYLLSELDRLAKKSWGWLND